MAQPPAQASVPSWRPAPKAPYSIDFGMLRPSVFDDGMDQEKQPYAPARRAAAPAPAPPATLHEAAAPWMLPLPARIATAADKFDRRHGQNTAVASKLLTELCNDFTSAKKARAFDFYTKQVRRNRYWAPPPPPVVIKHEPKKNYRRHSVKAEPEVVEVPRPLTPPPWSLDISIWHPRKLWCDSKDYYDTEDCERKKLASVVERARHVGMQKFIMSNDDDDGEGDDDDGDGIPDEVEQVEAVLWESHDLIFMLFDMYTAKGDDLTSLDYNEYTKIVKDFRLAHIKLKRAKPSDLDTIFIAVDVASKKFNNTADKALQDKYEREKSLSIAEFIHALVRIAVARYIFSGDEKDVSSAMLRMMTDDINARAKSEVLLDNNVFREKYCYNEATDRVLRRHETSLRLLYNTLATKTTPQIGPMLTFYTWRQFVVKLELLDIDVSERESSMCFTASRMCVAKPYSVRGYHASTAVPFEGFLECLVRFACLKAFPTDEEIAEADQPDAYGYLKWLSIANEEKYDLMLETLGTPWGSEPRQPADRCLDHLMVIIVKTIESTTTMSADSNLTLEKKELNAWWHDN